MIEGRVSDFGFIYVWLHYKGPLLECRICIEASDGMGFVGIFIAHDISLASPRLAGLPIIWYRE